MLSRLARHALLAAFITAVFAAPASSQPATVTDPQRAGDGLAPLWDTGTARLPGHRAARAINAPLAPFVTSSLPEDAAWEGFVTPALAREGASPTEYHGKLVLWGDITAAGHQAAGGVVLWDGTHFETTPPVSPVRALTIWNDRIIAAVAPPRTSSDQPPTYILSFNGSSWDTLGTANTLVTDMTVFEARLVAVGFFSTINGVSVSEVAAFDGVSWSGFGSGITGHINSVVVHSGTLIVGGSFSSVSNIASWDAISGTWHTLGAGLDNSVAAMVSDGVGLFACGNFKKSGATTLNGVGRWDGVTWNSVGAPAGSEPQSMTLWNGKVIFPHPNGVTRLLAWDGVGLSALPGDSIGFNEGGGVGSLGTWGTSLVVTGAFYRNGSVPVPGILLYDGTQWSTLGEAWDGTQRGPGPGDVTDMRAWGGSLVVAGQFGLVSDQDHYSITPGIVAWDGTHWSALGGGIGGTQIWLGDYQGDLIAAGWLTIVRSALSLQRVVRWNGLTWNGFGTNAPDFANSIQQLGNDLYIGNELTPDSPYALYKWNGTAWSSVPGDILVYALGATVDSLVVGGYFDGTSGPPSPNVAFWDGASWRAAGAGVNDVVFATANWNGRVVIGGYFTATGANPLPGVAVWDGANWQPLGGNVVAVDRLRMFQGELLASGDFRLPDNSIVETVARYIGPDWQLLGSGSNNYVFEGFNGDLYQAGTGIVHGHVAHSFARRALLPVLAAPRPESGSLALSASPNPARGLAGFSFTLPSAGHARVTVLDLAGRHITTLADGAFEAGPHRAAWTTPGAPGVYLALLETGAGRVSRRFVVLER